MANVEQNESQPLNDLKVSMKCSEKFFTFDKKTYPPILREYIPKKDWEQIALEATRVIGTAWLKKKNHEKVQIPKWMYMTSIITIILLLFYFITLYIFGNSSNENTFLLTISMAAIIAGLILSFCLAIYNFVRQLGPSYSFKHFYVKEFVGYLKDLNARYKNKATFVFNSEKMQLECTLLNKINQ